MSITYMSLGWKLALEPTDLLVYLAIADHVDDEGEGCYASYNRLAAKTNLGRSTVIRVVGRLRKAGIIVHQGTHPRHGTNVWNIALDKLPFKEHAAGGPGTSPADRPGAAADCVAAARAATPPGIPATPGRSQADTPPGIPARPPQSRNGTPAGVTARPKPSYTSVEPSDNHTGGRQALPPAPDARVVPLARPERSEGLVRPGRSEGTAGARQVRGRALAGTDPDEREEARARDRPETALQAQVAQLTHSRYLSANTKARLRNDVTAVWGDNKRPVTHPSPEEEWADHPELFAEYVELCARRIREESGRPPSRDALVQSIRSYARFNTGWLDFRQAAQAEAHAGALARGRPWYYDPSKPSWMQ